MFDLARNSVFEQPVHSFIFDTCDPVWGTYFSVAELRKIKQYDRELLVDTPAHVEELLSSLEGNKYNNAAEIYEHAMKWNVPLGSDERWMQESVLAAVKLLTSHKNHLQVQQYSEGNILHELWPFVYKLYKDRKILAKLGEVYSVATSLARNRQPSLEAITARERKAAGSRIDIIFAADGVELGACEVGKADVTVIDDKYLNDGLKKLPKTLRDMLVVQIVTNRQKASSLCTVGYLMMGLSMELLVMDMPFGGVISRVVRSPRFVFPDKSKNFQTDFISLLELAYTGKQIMQRDVIVLDDRKRRKIFDDNDEQSVVGAIAFSFS